MAEETSELSQEMYASFFSFFHSQFLPESLSVLCLKFLLVICSDYFVVARALKKLL